MRISVFALFLLPFLSACPDFGDDDDATPVADDDDATDDDDDSADDDDAAPPPVLPFTSSTGGGGTLQSDNFTLELYAFPTEPVGTTSSSSYVLQLGPGAVRAASLPSE